MLMRLKCLVGIAFCAFLVGCDQDTLMKKWIPSGSEESARAYVDALRQGKFDQIARDLDPSVTDAAVPSTFAKMATMLPAETPRSVKVVGAHMFRGQEYSTASLTLEYQFPSKWLLVDVTTKKMGGVATLVGFHVTPLSDSLENQNRFTLAGKGIVQYSVLALAVSSLAFSLYVLVLCLRMKGVTRKWLWAPFILVGAEKLAVNWTTGQLSFGVLAVQIPCGTASHALYGPWTVGVFLPIGAIVFLNRQRKMTISDDSISPLAQGPSETEASAR
jgi:hypothetical protein